MATHLFAMLAWLGFAIEIPAVAQVERMGWTYALLPTEQTHNVSDNEGAAFRSALLDALVSKNITVLDRTMVSRLFQETDLAAVLSPEAGNTAYHNMRLSADSLLVPGLCRIGDDFILTLREVSAEGKTVMCSTRKTRLRTDFASIARAIILEQTTATQPEGCGDDADALREHDLRKLCTEQKSHLLFPELWKRIKAIEQAADQPTQASVDRYYTWILELTALASSPPEGMAFVPGGWVSIDGPKGPAGLAVDPFYVDLHAVTVEEYKMFMEQLSSDTHRDTWKPIVVDRTAADNAHGDLTGVTWEAARAYTDYRRAQLPSEAQWLRLLGFLSESVYELRDNRTDTSRSPSHRTYSSQPATLLRPEITLHFREWTSTWDGPYRLRRGNILTEPYDGVLKIIYGGCYNSELRLITAKSRLAAKPGEAFTDVGFRCVRPFFRAVNGENGKE